MLKPALKERKKRERSESKKKIVVLATFETSGWYDHEAFSEYSERSQVVSEEVVGEPELPLEQSINHDVNHQEGRSSEIIGNIKIEPQVADDDDETPPKLQAEKPTHEIFLRSQVFVENDGVVRCHSPGGSTQFVTVTRGADGSEMYIDENGEEVQMVDDVTEDLRTVEFNFLDSKNICCGLCGEIVPYDNLMSHHLPQHHPEVLGEAGGMNLEEVPYESWLKDKLYMEKKNMESGFRYDSAMASDDLCSMRMRDARPLRKVSQIRVNPIKMDVEQLNHALNKKMIEKMGRKVPVSLVDKQHAKCGICNAVVSLNKKFEIVHLVRHFNAWHPSAHRCTREGTVTNSQLTFGRRNKPKRSFVQPRLRQAIPTNSKYVEAVTECQWKCKLCQGNIFGAVISAGAIRHFKQYHPGEMENMQYELCKARLDRVSGGCMEFVHPQLVECLVCNLTYTLHKPYNMCRGIRHLKLKHPTMMPENCEGTDKTDVTDKGAENIRMGEIIDDPEMLARFKSEYQVDFDKVQAVYGEDNEPVYVLLGADETLDPRTASQMIQSLGEGNNDNSSTKRVVVGPRASMAADNIDCEIEEQYIDAGYMEDDPEGEEFYDHYDAAQQR